MGFLSGDNITSIIVGKPVTTNQGIEAYDSPGIDWVGRGGNLLGTIPAGTYLGICDNTADHTYLSTGFWFLHFPAPEQPIGTITTDFWVKYDPSYILVNGKPPKDNSYFNGLPEPFSKFIDNVGGSVWKLVLLLVIVVAILAGIYIYFNRSQK